jgi:DNA polymerase III subunit delta'
VQAKPLLECTEHQPRARVALCAALAAGPTHSYLLRGPRGAGKRSAARAFAAEIIAAEAEDPEEARRRVLQDPSPHPDLLWLAPRGIQHLVEEVRERVIRAASYRPFEGGKRVFVIEAAEALRDESQNALLKTLEEPPPYVHLLLLSSEPEALLETVTSRCQPVEFLALPIPAIELDLAGATDRQEAAAAARLSAGDLERARFLITEQGRGVRARVELSSAAVLGSGPERSEPADSSGSAKAPWRKILEAAERAGAEAEATTREALEQDIAAGAKRSARDIADQAKRAARRRRTEILDLGLELSAVWFRDLAAIASDATAVAYNRDRLAELEIQASGLDAARPRRAAELIQDTRRRLDLNVSEELALEALYYRLERALSV